MPTARQRGLVNYYYRALYGYRFTDENGARQTEPGLATGLKVQVTTKKVPKGLTKKERERFRAKNPSLEELQEVSGTPKLPYLKGGWFDSIQGKSGKLLKPRVTKGKRGVGYRIGYIKFGFIPFNKRNLALSANREMDRILNSTTQTKFLIKCGKSQTHNQESRNTVKSTVIGMTEKYANYKQWLFGIVPIEYTNQKSFDKYQADHIKTLAKRKAKRRQERAETEKQKKLAKQAKERMKRAKRSPTT